MSHSRYQLIDFGDGRKLESLAGYLIDRPSPAAANTSPRDRHLWTSASARYDARSKSWDFRRQWPDDLDIDCVTFRVPVRPTPHGHIGLFPEQAANWKWLGNSARAIASPHALNLFAYTGASTIALAAAGFQVAHVDAAKPNVQAAGIAARHNQLQEAPIRYLVDDAAKFTAREVRRGRRYHTIVLDPPAYGHSPAGKAWRLERDLWPLLEDCLLLLDRKAFRLLITGHSPQVGEAEVVDFLRRSPFIAGVEAIGGLLLETGRSQLKDGAGRSLDAGFYVRAQSA